MIWVAAAGPAMNVALAVVSAILLSGIGVLDGENAALVGNALLLSIELNMILAIFNMLPLPPLDGSKVVAAFLPESLRRPYLRFGRYGMTVLLLLVFVVPILAAQAGIRFDIFGWLVLGPAEALTRALLTLFGQAAETHSGLQNSPAAARGGWSRSLSAGRLLRMARPR